MLIVSSNKVFLNELVLFPAPEKDTFFVHVPNSEQFTVSELVEKIEFWAENKIEKVVCPNNDLNKSGTKRITMVLAKSEHGRLLEQIKEVRFE